MLDSSQSEPDSDFQYECIVGQERSGLIATDTKTVTNYQMLGFPKSIKFFKSFFDVKLDIEIQVYGEGSIPCPFLLRVGLAKIEDKNIEREFVKRLLVYLNKEELFYKWATKPYKLERVRRVNLEEES